MKKTDTGWRLRPLHIGLLVIGASMTLTMCFIVKVALPYFLPKSICYQKLVVAQVAAKDKNSDAKHLMLEACSAAEDQKQPLHDRARVMYEVVNWLHDSGDSQEALSRYAPAIALLEQANLQGSLGDTLSSQADDLSNNGESEKAVAAIERSLEIKQSLPARSVSIAWTRSLMPNIYLAANATDKAEKSNVSLRKLISAEGSSWSEDRRVYYQAQADLNDACIAVAKHQIAKSQSFLKKSIALTDKQSGAGNETSELSLVTYVKALKSAKEDALANLYNEKLDCPLEFSNKDWKSRVKAFSN